MICLRFEFSKSRTRTSVFKETSKIGGPAFPVSFRCPNSLRTPDPAAENFGSQRILDKAAGE
jgi:hypothetical protein